MKRRAMGPEYSLVEALSLFILNRHNSMHECGNAAVKGRPPNADCSYVRNFRGSSSSPVISVSGIHPPLRDCYATPPPPPIHPLPRQPTPRSPIQSEAASSLNTIKYRLKGNLPKILDWGDRLQHKHPEINFVQETSLGCKSDS